VLGRTAGAGAFEFGIAAPLGADLPVLGIERELVRPALQALRRHLRLDDVRVCIDELDLHATFLRKRTLLPSVPFDFQDRRLFH